MSKSKYLNWESYILSQKLLTWLFFPDGSAIPWLIGSSEPTPLDVHLELQSLTPHTRFIVMLFMFYVIFKLKDGLQHKIDVTLFWLHIIS